MSKFVIQGGKPLKGSFPIAGMKNAATPILAASLILDKPVTITNVPGIIDVERMMGLISSLGATVTKNDVSAVTIDSAGMKAGNPDSLAVKRLRSSVLLLGPLLAKFGSVTIPTPGGCSIGSRPIDTHLDAFRQMGIDVTEHGDDTYTLQKKDNFTGTVILSEFSVTATENIVTYAATLDGTTVIKMAAAEPHVQDLCNFLVAAGAEITGIGTHTLVVKGSKNLHLDTWTIIPDQIEIGTMVIAAAATRGELDISPIIPDHLLALFIKLKEIGVPFEVKDDHLIVGHAKTYKSFNLQALPYPGFPTDLQAPMAVLATQATGLSLIHDPLYNARFSYIQELTRMGVQAVVCDPHRVLINGPAKLRGEKIKSFDLRAGVTLILAGLVAEGETVIEDAEMVDRGYERFEERLFQVGAQIKREAD